MMPAMDEKGLAERQRCEREWTAFQAWWKSSGHAADPNFTLTMENCTHAAWQARALSSSPVGEMVPITECASEGCAKQATVRFERGGVGSYYCDDCYMRIQAIPAGRGGR